MSSVPGRSMNARVRLSLLFLATTGSALATEQTKQTERPGSAQHESDVAVGQTAEAEVVVQGDLPHPQAAPKAPNVSGSVVRHERLEAPGINAAYVLREVPGVQVTELGGLGSPATASIRGATSAQTPVYVAGIRVNDEVGGAANLADVPLFLMDRVEVYRSHAPLNADRLGVGGAIFFEPRSPQGNRLALGAETGSFGQRAAWAHGAYGDAGRGVLAGVKLTAAKNNYPFFNGQGTLFVDDDGRVSRLHNADVNLASVWLLARQNVGRAWLSLLYNHIDREQGAPKLALTPTKEARTAFNRHIAGLKSLVPVDVWNGGLELLVAGTIARTRVEDPLGELGLLTPETRLPGARVEQRTRATQRFGALSLVQQVAFSTEKLQRLEQVGRQRETTMTAKRVVTRTAAGAQYDFSENTSADTLISLSCFDTSQGALGWCNHREPAMRLGAQHQLGQWQFYGNWGRYLRLPTLGEQYGVSLLVRGNRKLRTETGTTLEFGTRWQYVVGDRRQFWVDLAAFTRDAQRLINYVRTAQGYLFPRNSKRAEFKGAELSLGSEPTAWLEFAGAASALDPRDTSDDRTSDNNILPYQSLLKAYLLMSVRRRFSELWLNELNAIGRWTYQSNRYADPAGLGLIPRQQWADLEFNAVTFNRQLTLRGRLSNIFDERRFDVVGFPLPGRSAFFSMEASW